MLKSIFHLRKIDIAWSGWFRLATIESAQVGGRQASMNPFRMCPFGPGSDLMKLLSLGSVWGAVAL